MSAGGPGRREVAHRIFAAEYDDATLEYAESDEERAPNYVVTPSGARVNRLFVVGVLTAVEQVNEDTVRARIADPTGVFVVYAGQYQPDELAALQSLESPAFVAVTGKANTFSPEGSDRVLTSVRPERVTEVDAETRDRWVVATAEHTLARIQTIASALEREERGEDLRAALLRDGVEPGFAEGVSKALDHYDTTADYLGALRDLANQALEVVAGERSEVEALEIAPGEGDGTVSAGDLADLLPEERQSATEAAEDVDPEVLLESDASDAGEPADEAQGDDGQDDAGQADEETGTGADAEAEAETDESGAEEPVTDERAVEATADDAEEAADTEPDDADGPEPETSESSIEETAADAEAAAETHEGDGSADADDADELYEVDEAEREEIEEEYGVEFQSGTEVDPAGEAGIETEDEPPAADESVGEDESVEEAADEDESVEDDADETPVEEDAEETLAEDDAEETDASEDSEDEAESEEAESDEADESAEDVDLEGAVLSEMETLDEGDGADREALVEAVAGETGAEADAIDDAIDDLLMSGQCYEPTEGSLKPI